MGRAISEEASSRMAAETTLQDSANQAQSEVSKKVSDLQAQEKEDRDFADSALAK